MVLQNECPKWSQAILQPAKEFNLTPLPVIAGTIPPELTGTLFRQVVRISGY